MMRMIIHEQLLLQNIFVTPFHHHYTENLTLCYCIRDLFWAQNKFGVSILKKHFEHIPAQLSEADPFLPEKRSKTMEHTDRLRSNFFENENFEKTQNLMKIEENKS